MIGGKKIQNFITFQTKQTIFLKQNEPQLIVHQQTIETDSYKQLLSTKRSKQKPNYFQNQKHEKENVQNNQPRKSQDYKKSHINSSNSKSRNTSKQRSGSTKYKNVINKEHLHLLNKVKQFDLKQDTKRSRSNKNKLSKKAKSMIRLPKFVEKNAFQPEKSKLCRKSYSPSRNYSEGMKRTNTNNCSTQCIKTTKFTQSKDNTTIKHMKSVKTDKNTKKQAVQNKSKLTKSKDKLKTHLTSNKNINETKNYNTEKRKEDIFNRIDTAQKSKKTSKKISPSKKPEISKKRTLQQTKPLKAIKQKMLPKKRKSMSKSKKNLHHFESVDQMLLRHQGYETNRNETTGLTNYLSSRDSFKKKVKTDRDSFNKPKKKSSPSSRQKQKEIIISSKNLKRIQNNAAIKIQKVYKGYITRKWLNEYLRIISAAVVVQKYWRGYIQRKKFQKIIEKFHLKNEKTKIIARIDPIALESRQVSNQDSKMNIDRWKDILFEVMQERTVNEALKSRIKNFLQNEGESARSSMVSQRSHNSEQKLQEEIMSERRYFQKKLQKKEELSHSGKKIHKYLQSPQSFHIENEHSFIEQQSSSNKRSSIKSSQVVSHLMSPQSMPISPKLRKSQSPEKIMSNLQEIQSYQRHIIMQEAKNQKRELQQQLNKNVCSPRSFELKERQIDKKMQKSLRDFQGNMKGVMESCKNSKSIVIGIQQASSFSESVMVTPQNSQVKEALAREQLQHLSEDEVKSKLFEKMDNTSIQEKSIIISCQKGTYLQEPSPEHSASVPTYENFQTFNINALSSQKSSSQPKAIDTSCTFLDEYLLTMIEYLRNKNDGKVMNEIVKGVKSQRNLSPYTVLRNLSVVKEDDNGDEDGFSLPLYKYLQDDNEILKEEHVADYNKYFNMMKSSHKFEHSPQQREQGVNEPLEHYMKLLVDSFNEALNLKRPSTYLFTDRAVESFNSKQVIQNQYDLQSQYDIYCATAMQEIFTWFNVKYGCILSQQNQEDISLQQLMTQNASRLQQMMRMEGDKKWDQYYERIETIAKISEEIFEELVLKETLTILNVEKKFLKQRELRD